MKEMHVKNTVKIYKKRENCWKKKYQQFSFILFPRNKKKTNITSFVAIVYNVAPFSVIYSHFYSDNHRNRIITKTICAKYHFIYFKDGETDCMCQQKRVREQEWESMCKMPMDFWLMSLSSFCKMNKRRTNRKNRQ